MRAQGALAAIGVGRAPDRVRAERSRQVFKFENKTHAEKLAKGATIQNSHSQLLSASSNPLPVLNRARILQEKLKEKTPDPPCIIFCAKRVRARGDTLLEQFPRATYACTNYSFSVKGKEQQT